MLRIVDVILSRMCGFGDGMIFMGSVSIENLVWLKRVDIQRLKRPKPLSRASLGGAGVTLPLRGSW
jgi:hypothetical protein